jgi:glycosyltransferase involved in cell wall biosynthesis
MPESIAISIVTPTYNRAHMLPRAWNSLKNQLAEFEWIIVDDGSTDDTALVVAAFGDPRIKYYRQSLHTGGANVARNIGTRAARGPLVVFLDDDDELYPDSLLQMILTMEQADAEVGVAVFQCVFENGPVDMSDVIDGAIYGEADIVCGLMPSGERLFIYRREVFDEFQLPEDLLFSEGVFVYAVSKKYKFLMVAQLGRIYHEHGGNVSRAEHMTARSKLIAIGYERIVCDHAEVLDASHRVKAMYLIKALYRYGVAGCGSDMYRVFWAAMSCGDWSQRLQSIVIIVLGALGLTPWIDAHRVKHLRKKLMGSNNGASNLSR